MTQTIKTRPTGQKPALSRRPQRAHSDIARWRAEGQTEADDRKLDEALRETFPASDPAVSTPRKP